jgi:chromosomal replication initiation ATPase DnaA
MIQPANYSSVAEMRTGYAECRRRLMGAKTPAQSLPSPVTAYRRPLWQRIDTTFSDHVTTWQIYLAGQYFSPVKKFMREWCRARNITIEEMIGPSQFRRITLPRHMLVYELHRQFNITLPQLGRIFGGRDHTTMINSIRRAETMLADIERAAAR